MLLVAAAVAGEPISLASTGTPLAGGAGGGLNGMTDPDSVSASGRMSEDDEIGKDVLADAGDPDKLLKLPGADSPDNLGIPGVMAEAYMTAAEILATSQPNCNLHWSLLASIGRIESNHARHGKVDADGNTVPHILGPVLNGGGFAAIQDTDGGRYDDDARWDRAVGAMQFIPSTWAGYASDGNGDGVTSPHNVFDATVAAGKYLCSGGLDLSNPQDQATAVFRYNHSDSYVATVLLWADAYANGFDAMPSDPVLPDDYDYDDGYDGGYDDGGGLALGPPSNGDTPPAQQIPSTNTQAPPPTTVSTRTQPPETTATTKVPPSCWPTNDPDAVAPPAADEATTTTTTSTVAGAPPPADSEATTTTTEPPTTTTTTTTPPLPPC